MESIKNTMIKISVQSGPKVGLKFACVFSHKSWTTLRFLQSNLLGFIKIKLSLSVLKWRKYFISTF